MILQAQLDAKAHATTRQQAADRERNQAVRAALALIHDGQRDKARMLLQLSVGMQAWLEGLA